MEYVQRKGLHELVYPYELFGNEELCSSLCLEVKRKLQRNARGIDKRFGISQTGRDSMIDKVHIAKSRNR